MHLDKACSEEGGSGEHSASGSDGETAAALGIGFTPLLELGLLSKDELVVSSLLGCVLLCSPGSIISKCVVLLNERLVSIGESAHSSIVDLLFLGFSEGHGVVCDPLFLLFSELSIVLVIFFLLLRSGRASLNSFRDWLPIGGAHVQSLEGHIVDCDHGLAVGVIGGGSVDEGGVGDGEEGDGEESAEHFSN